MKTVKISFILCTIFFSSIKSNAQEISAYLNGGFQGLDYKVNYGDNDIKFGGKIGVGYTYFINKNWGIVTGAEFGIHKNKTTLVDRIYTTYELDIDNDIFEYRVKTTNYKEKNTFNTISIPLMIQYRTTGETQFYINGGARVFFPFSYKTKASVDAITMTGYYEDINVELVDLPKFGFKTVTDWGNTTKNDLKTAFALSGETGVSFKLSEKIRLYTGIYADYGLNDILKKNQSANDIPLVKYNSDGSVIVQPNGVIKANDLVDKAKLLNYGIQVRIGFNAKRKNKELVTKETKDDTFLNIIEEDVAVENQPKEEKIIVQPKKEITKQEIQQIEEHILFKTLGNTTLSDENKIQINNVSNILKKYPEQKVAITGYTCSIGTEERNVRARLKRAQAVATELENNGIEAQQFEIKTVDEYVPLYPNNTEINRQRNRRVVITVLN